MTLSASDAWREVDDVAALATRVTPERLRRGALELLGSRAPGLAATLADADIRLFGVSSGFFFYPLVQWTEWEEIAPDVIERFGVALALGHMHYAIQDAHIDAGGAPPEWELASEAVLLLYLRELSATTGVGIDQTLELHLAYFEPYADAHLNDVAKRRSWEPYTEVEVCKLAHKSAPIGAVIRVLAAASKQSVDRANAAVDALFDFCCGLQLVDDLLDLPEDLRRGNATPAATELTRCSNLGVNELRKVASAPGGELDVQGFALVNGIAERTFLRANAYFRRAADAARRNGLICLTHAAESRTRQSQERYDESVSARISVTSSRGRSRA